MLKKLLPSTKPMQTMVDAGWLIDAPAGKFPPVKGVMKHKRKKSGRAK
jgi:hypothetical protein